MRSVGTGAIFYLGFLAAVWHACSVAARGLPQSIGCNYRGTLNKTSQRCSCMSGYAGPDCSQKLCEVGNAWVDLPTADDTAHGRWTECSGVGYCDRLKGECACRAGFEGLGCQYLACPTDASGQACSGNGKCVTMREAAMKWDGRNLLRPRITYSHWDADQIQGCVCDPGFSGHNCAIKECPRGDDPTTTGQQNELMKVACTADGGYWFFSFRGETSRAIPFNAGYGTVERLLEAMGTIRDVEVTFSDLSTDAAPACSASGENVMSIEFKQDFGALPAARVDGSRLTLGGASYNGFISGGSGASLAMVSEYSVTCSSGADDGVIYFLYDEAHSQAVRHNANADSIRQALSGISTLGGSKNAYGNTTIDVAVGGTGVLCEKSAPVTTNITLRAIYGNLLDLSVIVSLVNAQDKSLVNVTVESNKGTKENAVCSGRGDCDHETGFCKCNQKVVESTTKYRYWYASSDGYGNLGPRGDCGHAKVTPMECPAGKIMNYTGPCAGRGGCDNATMTCQCYKGFEGSACELRSCPVGNAWFDEASADGVAHAPAECSGRGTCDYETGRCMCDSLFEGAACDRMSCPTGTGYECNGHGRCLPLWRLAAEAQDAQGTPTVFAYGNSDDAFNEPAQWDRDMVHGCLCDTRNDMQPANGPISFISGVLVDNSMSVGYTGYDCSRQWCPTGDDPLTEPGDYEVQTLGCNSNTTGNFSITFRGQTTTPINPFTTADEVEAILEALSTIGDVSVAAPSNDANYTACHPSYGQWSAGIGPANRSTFLGFAVTFYTELGDLPEMVAVMEQTGDAIAVNETTKGTKENDECSNRGICDYDTGQCKCMPGFASSAGNGTMAGLRRDCGRRSDDFFTLNPYYAEDDDED